MHNLMSIPFSLYAPRASGLHDLHPLTKLTLAGFFLFFAILASEPWVFYVAFAALLLPLAMWGRVVRPFLRTTWRVVAPFALSLILIQGFFWRGGAVLFAFGPLSMKVNGLIFAVAGIGRILIVVSSFLLLSLTTRPDALMLALVQRGLPGNIAYIVLTTLQIVPRFQAKANTILDAQRSRGLETQGSLIRRLRAIFPLVVPLVLGSLVDIEERAIALEARAFSRSGPRTSLFDLPDSRVQVAFRWALVLVMVGMAVARVLLVGGF